MKGVLIMTTMTREEAIRRYMEDNTTTLLRFKRTYGEKLIGLWLYESLVGIDTDEWKVTQNKIAKVKSVLQDVCYMLADNDEEIALHYYLSYINYLDQKTNHILDELD